MERNDYLIAMADLTPRQEQFCQEYLVDLNGTQAAIRAGYSKKTANEQASQLLAKLNIGDRVAELQAKRAERLEITADDVLREYARIGFADMADYYEEGGKLKSIHDLGDKSRVVGEVQTETFVGEAGTTTKVKFKLHDKLKALDSVGKHIGFYLEDNKQKLPPTIKVTIVDPTTGD